LDATLMPQLFETALNLKAATALLPEIPPTVLAADEAVEKQAPHWSREDQNLYSAMHTRCLEWVSCRHQTMSASAAAFAESGHDILPGMSTRPRSSAGDPMTLGKMRATGCGHSMCGAGSATTGRS
jgi:hypothetical protein